MTGRVKHMRRSRYSAHSYKPFGSFYQKASVKAFQKKNRETFGERIKSFMHKMINK